MINCIIRPFFLGHVTHILQIAAWHVVWHLFWRLFRQKKWHQLWQLLLHLTWQISCVTYILICILTLALAISMSHIFWHTFRHRPWQIVYITFDLFFFWHWLWHPFGNLIWHGKCQSTYLLVSWHQLIVWNLTWQFSCEILTDIDSTIFLTCSHTISHLPWQTLPVIYSHKSRGIERERDEKRREEKRREEKRRESILA